MSSEPTQDQLTCPVSGSRNCFSFLEIPDVPVFCNVLYDTRDEALAAARGNITLAYCPDSGHVFNAAFDPRLVEYSPVYENSLHFSPHFQRFAEALADRLIDTYDIRNKHVIDIGCGKGDFLGILCDRGSNTGTGFDPSYESRDVVEADTRPFSVVKDLYSDKYSDQKADFISCRHVLEHVQDPQAFLGAIRTTIGNRSNTPVYFEVPDALFILRDMAVWDIIYEHVSYYSSVSLAALVERSSFDVKRTYSHFSGQYLSIESAPSDTIPFDATPINATPSNATPIDATEARRAVLEELNALVASFAQRYNDKVTRWRNLLDEIDSDNSRVVIWGAGSKGVTILNILDTKDRIKFAVDVNPRKQGKFIAGSGQQIISPQALAAYRPDVVLLMNGIYQSEVEAMLAGIGLSPSVIAA